MVKVLLAKLGLDVHSRGIILVANALRNAGMEVIYIGNAMPAEIVNSAIQEDVDVIGVSSLGGAHLTLGKKLTEVAEKELDCFVVIGGVFSLNDAAKLTEMFDGVFTPESDCEEIINSIQKMVEEK